MTSLGIMITFIVGILILIIGVVTKKKLLMKISILPLFIAIVQMVMLFIM